MNYLFLLNDGQNGQGGSSINYVIMMLLWGAGISAFILFIPRNRRRRFFIAFLFCQAVLWLSSLFHVKYHLLAFPVREFPKATDLLVTTEYFFYPVCCGFYVVFEPKRSFLIRILYLAVCCSGIVVLDVILEKYTDLIKYVHYKWYLTWINAFGIAAVTNIVCKWFFKSKESFRKDREAAQ